MEGAALSRALSLEPVPPSLSAGRRCPRWPVDRAGRTRVPADPVGRIRAAPRDERRAWVRPRARRFGFPWRPVCGTRPAARIRHVCRTRLSRTMMQDSLGGKRVGNPRTACAPLSPGPAAREKDVVCCRISPYLRDGAPNSLRPSGDLWPDCPIGWPVYGSDGRLRHGRVELRIRRSLASSHQLPRPHQSPGRRGRGHPAPKAAGGRSRLQRDRRGSSRSVSLAGTHDPVGGMKRCHGPRDGTRSLLIAGGCAGDRGAGTGQRFPPLFGGAFKVGRTPAVGRAVAPHANGTAGGTNGERNAS